MIYHTQAQAARMLGVTRQAIGNAIRRGQLKTVAIANELRLVSTAEIERYRRQVATRYDKGDQFRKSA